MMMRVSARDDHRARPFDTNADTNGHATAPPMLRVETKRDRDAQLRTYLGDDL
jgi:hypothetical protein